MKNTFLAFKSFIGSRFPAFADAMWNFRYLSKKDQSQFGEMSLLNTHLRYLNTLNYLELGCYQPVFLSNSYFLKRKGSRGVHVDANRSLAIQWKLFRHKEPFVVAAVVPENEIGSKILYTFPRRHGVLSSLDPEFIKPWISAGLSPKEELIDCISICEIFQTTTILLGKVDLILIDVEGYDFKLLENLLPNIDSPPKWILAEDTGGEVNTLLTKFGYEELGTAGPSALFKLST